MITQPNPLKDHAIALLQLLMACKRLAVIARKKAKEVDAEGPKLFELADKVRARQDDLTEMCAVFESEITSMIEHLKERESR
jgi:hypothetical protein